MRSFLGFVVFTATLVALLAVFLVPPVVGPMVAAAVREASPFGDQPLEVQVDVDAVGLVRGFVREIRISGSDLEAGGVTIESLDVVVRDVETGGEHGFSDVSGGLDDVLVPRDDGTTVGVRRVGLAGASSAVLATVAIDPDAALTLVDRALQDAGIDPEGAELVDAGVAIRVAEQRVVLALLVVDGAIVVPAPGGTLAPVLDPGPADPWRVLAVSVTAAGIEIDAMVDAVRLLAN
jgi:hypothetical protein